MAVLTTSSKPSIQNKYNLTRYDLSPSLVTTLHCLDSCRLLRALGIPQLTGKREPAKLPPVSPRMSVQIFRWVIRWVNLFTSVIKVPGTLGLTHRSDFYALVGKCTRSLSTLGFVWYHPFFCGAKPEEWLTISMSAKNDLMYKKPSCIRETVNPLLGADSSTDTK